MSIDYRNPELTAHLPAAAPTLWSDGYDWQAKTEKLGWTIAASWGRDGWDLGDWPYVQYGYVDVPAEPGPGDLPGAPAVFGYLAYCEGDVTVKAYLDERDRDRALDEAFLFHMKHSTRGREIFAEYGIDLLAISNVDQLPPQMRGRFSWSRCGEGSPEPKLRKVES